jgi:hypothetical protein
LALTLCAIGASVVLVDQVRKQLFHKRGAGS